MDDFSIQCGQLCSILDAFSIGVITVSPTHRIMSMNTAAERLTGHKKKDVIGKSCHQSFVRDLCGRECKLDQTVHSEQKVFRPSVPSSVPPRGKLHPAASGEKGGEIRFQQYEKHYITKVVSPLYTSDESVVGCIVVFQDHSAFRDLIDRIRYEDRRLKIILDNLDIGILTVDRGGHVTFFNTMAETVTGYSRGDILGRPYSTIFGNESCKDILLLKETIADGKARSNEEGEIITRDGGPIPIRARYMALKHEDGRIVGGLTTILDLSLMYQLKSAIKERYTFYDMVGKDPAMQRIFDILPVIAASDSTVLIEGPTGTGKDLLARIIHTASKRADKAMVKVNCAALPENLLESEMFGYVKGAFTGADRDKPGRFQEADGGTIFLDEIGDLPLPLQAKLLRVLEDREFYPLGSRRTTKVDVRIIAATNQEMERLVGEKGFREDLYYRLNVIRIELPELRARKADLPLLISHILKRLSITKNTRIDKISEDAMEVLLNYDYPGNIRELENILEHAFIICQGTTIEKKHLPPAPLKYVRHEPVGRPVAVIRQEEVEEKDRLLAMLRKYQWNRGHTAKALNIERTTLWRKMRKYNLFQ
ncbi:MAG TPA: sigma 54-interacting transcriptional regulator [Thermodesulfobacteriota bacterium]|nr:sigma 54-interacting transcriptional regulator [Thermodesulfobacteriota bacterium]